MTTKAHLVRQVRGRKRIDSARGLIFDLEEIFESLNQRFFYGLLARPAMTWSRVRARNSLAHYDPAHNAIVVSRIFDHARVPRYAVEYIVYHEMLHLEASGEAAGQPALRAWARVPGRGKALSRSLSARSSS